MKEIKILRTGLVGVICFASAFNGINATNINEMAREFGNECFIQGDFVYELDCYLDAPMWLCLHGLNDVDRKDKLVVPEAIEFTAAKIPDVFGYPGKIYEGVVSEISDEAFMSSAFKEIQLPSTLKRIGKRAFQVSKIERIDIPASVIMIDKEAFRGTQLREIHLPEGLAYLGAFGLATNDFLQKVSLPSTLNALNGFTFLHTYQLSEIICHNPIPPSASYSDFGLITGIEVTTDCIPGPSFKTCKLFVPEASLDLYKNHPVWGSFKNILPIESGITEVSEIKETIVPLEILTYPGYLQCSANDNCEFQIYDLDGKTVKNKQLNAGESWEFKSNGIFILKVKDTNFEKKIIL